MARFVSSLLLLAVFLVPVGARGTVLYHDTWYDGAQVALQLGNCPGECDAIMFQPNSYPFEVTHVYAIGGPGNANMSFDVVIMDEGVGGYPDYNSYLGGADNVNIQMGADPYWFEVDLTQLGQPATINSGKFAVAFCFLPNNNPCNSWGLGSDMGPPLVPDGGVIYYNNGEMCFSGSCIGGSGEYAWTPLSTFANRNWIIRAASEHWEPGWPTDDDDDDAQDDDAVDDDAVDDDAVDDDAQDDDTGTSDLTVQSITPNVINEGDLSGFTIAGEGFQDDADVYIGALRIMPVDVDPPDTISGAFPNGLLANYYDVCVENPDGADDCLISALHVVSAGGCGDCTVVSQRSIGSAVAALVLGGLLIAWRRLR